MANVYHYLDAGCWAPFSSAIPEGVTIIGSNYSLPGWAYASGSANEQLFARFRAILYASGNLTVDVDWYSRSGSTSGSPTWGAALSVLTPGDAQSMETDTFATENTQSTAVNGTAKGLTRTTITVSNLDSLAIDDSVCLRLRRTDNSMTGDAIMLGVTVSYLST